VGGCGNGRRESWKSMVIEGPVGLFGSVDEDLMLGICWGF
jgi:hypothetical protein